MSRVTSLRACSSLSLDAARMDLLTVSRASSEAVPRTSMEPQTLSISSDLCWTPAMEKDFCMVSCPSTGRSEERRVGKECRSWVAADREKDIADSKYDE